MKRAHLLIGGLVKGVFFRFSMVDVAEELKVRGWCKNLDSDHLETVVEGDEEAVKKFIDWCQKGPEKAKVEEVKVDWQKPTGEFEGFTVKC
jgi:acylphosphatase